MGTGETVIANPHPPTPTLNLPHTIASDVMPKRELDWDENDFPRKRSRRREDDDEDDRPRKRRRRAKAGRSSSLPLVLGLLFGGMLLLLVAGGAVAAVFLWKGGLPGENAVANNPLGLPGGLTPAAPAIVRPSLPPGWVDFKHPECGMSIYCPQRPFPNEFYSHEPLGTPLTPGTARAKGYQSKPLQATKEKPLWCRVGVYEYPPSFSPAARELKLREAVLFKKPGADYRAVTWGGKAAVEGSGEDVGALPGTKSVTRHLWVGDRFYYAELTGTDGHPTAAEQAAFFDSFVLGQ